MFNVKKSTTKKENRVLRIYYRGFEKYDIKHVDPTEPFPRGYFSIEYDYALEESDGKLAWLQCVRSYKGQEYAVFSGMVDEMDKGEVIWRH